MTKIANLVTTLYDFAVERPEGFTNADFMAEHNVSLQDFNLACNRLRSALATDTITLVCDPNGANKKWVYRLVGAVEDGTPWVGNRLKDAETRFETIGNVVAALVKATDGRSADGRKARVMEKALRRMAEDLGDITGEVDTWSA